MSLLERIHGPADVKALTPEELPSLAEEIRREIIETTSANGGHVGPNLGVVELCIALHRVFDTPKDKILMDVSHQGYVHKLLTGRAPRFHTLRQTGGISGFLNREESAHDAYGAGHAGTAFSAAIGMAAARDLKGTDENVIAIVGDAALTCGITMEALNNAAGATKRLILILNDNEWSIAKNVGAVSQYLNNLITNPHYKRFHHDITSLLKKLPGGENILELGARAKSGAKDFLVPSSLFEKFDVRYLGPIDGHDIGLLEQYLTFAKNETEKPILLHVLTTKGKGYSPAVNNPEKFHGASPFEIATGDTKHGGGAEKAPNWQDAMGHALVRFARKDPSVVGITAAMRSGTGLIHLSKELPHQFFDTGIAEEHACVFAAGLAASGMKPVVAIYSTFLQRAYDIIVHDICLQSLPVTFVMDRAGLSANDGATHHGLYDIAYLRHVPRAVVMQPKDEDELSDMMHTALTMGVPTFIRYPRGHAQGVPIKETPVCLPLGKAEVLRAGADVQIWALGPWVFDALKIAEELSAQTGLSFGVVNARFAKPLDADLLLSQADAGTKLFVTMEDHTVVGGFGSAVMESLQQAGAHTPVERLGWPDQFIAHASSNDDARRIYQVTLDDFKKQIAHRLKALQS